jgi:hypothetical protein
VPQVHFAEGRLMGPYSEKLAQTIRPPKPARH